MPGPSFPEVDFLGQRFSICDLKQVAGWIEARAASAPFTYIVTPNAHHLVMLDRDVPGFRDAYAQAAMRLCDSRVVRAIARKLFGLSLPLVAGSDLTAWLFAHVVRPDDAITVIGGNDELERRLRQQYGLTQLFMHVPPMGFINQPAEVEACVRFICAHPARYVFLAVGAPQSEILAAQLSRTPGATGCGLCIGASLLFVTGLEQRAPAVWQRHGLEWLHRLASNPKRHARRIFVHSMPLFWLAGREVLKRQREHGAEKQS